MTEPAGSPVLFTVESGVGRITLNRPRAINALDHEMVALITPVLAGWASDDRVSVVVLDGAGDRGFCSGGDIKAIHADAVAGTDNAHDYWRDEYRLDVALARFGKPVVALMDGITMGGGVGLGGHVSHRVVTERSMIGMPEVNIGLIPDVGGTYLLAAAPGELGLHLGLTAGRMNGADAILAGFADHYVLAERLPELLVKLTELPVDEAIAAVAEPAPVSALADDQAWIDDCYARGDAEQIIKQLRANGSGGAVKAADAIEAASPTSVVATLRAVRQARERQLSLEQAINVEYGLCCAALHRPDLAEGIRAQVIDKDRNPTWSPAALAEVGDLDDWFAPATDLPFPNA